MGKLLQALLIALITAYLLFALFSEIVNKQKGVASVTPPIVYTDENELWNLVQEFRTSRGLKPFTKSDKLCEIATIRAPQVEVDHDHTGFREMYRKLGNQGFLQLSENALFINEGETNSCTARDGIMAWNNSESHHAALVREDLIYGCVRCVRCACSLIMAK